MAESLVAGLTEWNLQYVCLKHMEQLEQKDKKLLCQNIYIYFTMEG